MFRLSRHAFSPTKPPLPLRRISTLPLTVMPVLGISVLAMAALPRPALAAEVTVTISNFAFAPEKVTIAAGDSVTFVNGDDTIHSVVADDGSFHSEGLDTDGRSVVRFAKPGIIDYHCGLHPFMKGEIIVK